MGDWAKLNRQQNCMGILFKNHQEEVLKCLPLTVCVLPKSLQSLKSNPKCDDIRKCGVWEVIKLWGLSTGIIALIKGTRGPPGGPVVENPPANAGDMGSIPGPGRFHVPQGEARVLGAHTSQGEARGQQLKSSPCLMLTATKTQHSQQEGKKENF